MARPGSVRCMLPFVVSAFALAVCALILLLPTPNGAGTAPSPDEARFRTRQPNEEPAGAVRATVRERRDPCGMPTHRARLEITWEAQKVTWTRELPPLQLPAPYEEPVADFAEAILWGSWATYLDRHRLPHNHAFTADEVRQAHDLAEHAIQNSVQSKYGIVARVRVTEAGE